MLSSSINKTYVGTSRGQAQDFAKLRPWQTKVEQETDTMTQAATDEMLTQFDINNSWDEIEKEWFEAGTEFMIF
ncbi:MAG: hypothetical protein JOZ78_16895 [Chroococcidiopsidaceae cyanobacterium CP_BM_ER_R8_30]|nr:hypothetical protein [Chroococcidiopsidaceae cyanobacterium CP_BM_ER_R8_30]